MICQFLTTLLQQPRLAKFLIPLLMSSQLFYHPGLSLANFLTPVLLTQVFFSFDEGIGVLAVIRLITTTPATLEK